MAVSLVTGGAGFIGSHVADCLLESGDHVVILDDLSGGFPENIPAAATFVEGSVDSVTSEPEAEIFIIALQPRLAIEMPEVRCVCVRCCGQGANSIAGKLFVNPLGSGVGNRTQFQRGFPTWIGRIFP